MVKCSLCDKDINANDMFCPFCGAVNEVKKNEPQITKTQLEHLPELKKRKFWLWVIIILLTAGFGMILYLYLHLEDLKNLDQYPRPMGVPSPKAYEPGRFIAYYCFGYFFGLSQILTAIVFFEAFQKLHLYIDDHPIKQKTIPVPGKTFLLIIVVWSLFVYISAGYVYVAVETLTNGTFNIGFWSIIGIFILSGTLVIGFGIWILIMYNNWQKAYNERVDILIRA